MSLRSVAVCAYLAVTCLAVAWLGAACERATSKPARNVVIVVADTLRANRLGCYGYPRATSPNLDALAERGTLYEDNYSQACWTIPSMISLMSGLYVTQDEVALPKSPALAEVLQKDGLETAAFVANDALLKDAGFQRGFEHFETLSNEHAPVVADRFAGWHASREPSRRYFAWVHFIDPHQGYEPEADYDLFHDARPDRERLMPRWQAMQAKVAEYSPKLATQPFERAVESMERDNNLYDGEVRQVDEGLRRVLAELDRSGERDSTLVIFCADHGEMLFEHESSPLLIQDRVRRDGGLPNGVKDLMANGHRPWYYRDLWNTPLVFAGPGFPAHQRVRGLVQNLDLFPTVLESLDLPSARVQGTSLFGGLRPPLNAVFAHGHETSAVIDSHGRKLVLYPRQWFLLEGTGERPSVYFDAALDADETRDLGSEHPDEARALRAELEQWEKTFARQDADLHMTDEQRAMLKKLGYVDDR